MFTFFPNKKNKKSGFTLIEAIVSISIFIIVMVVSSTALLSIITANKQSHQIKSVMDNLNFALDSMTRDIRVGGDYCAGLAVYNPQGTGQTCNTGATPSTSFSYLSSQNKDSSGQPLAITYLYQSGQIQEIINGQTKTLTDPQISIQRLNFYVSGVGSATQKPRVVIVMGGTIGFGNTQSNFSLETSITQR